MNLNDLEINENSTKIIHPENVYINLKDHQLSIVHRCLEIEKFNLINIGIMNDKPGAGKTYAILALILYSNKKNNLIVIPQNLIEQWMNSIHQFSDILKYKKIINYNDILSLYQDENILSNDYDIIITTSLFYHSLSTTINDKFFKFSRVFFDEIDTISNIIMSKINCDFTWFVSASFNINEIGIYHLDQESIEYITCKCNDDYIDKLFEMDNYNCYKIICRNIYLDNIFINILDNEEFTILNALDYSRLKKKFHNKIASDEKEAIQFLISDKKDIIEMEKIRIQDLEKSIEESINKDKKELLKNQLLESQKSLKDSQEKLDLINERLKENDCCPLCYEEFSNKKKIVISQCCKNKICYDCTDNWFNNLHKRNCIYCNKENIKFESYILIKDEDKNSCKICDSKFENENDKYYSQCCNNNCCQNCLKDWYLRLLKKNCLFCQNESTLYEDFRNEKQHEDMLLNIKMGIKYTRKSKIEFLKYFLISKLTTNSKIIFCSQYTRIFKDLIKLLNKYNLKYLELDNGNFTDINDSIYEYKYGDKKFMLLNSNLFGCGLDLQITSDIVFLHKTEHNLQKQIIGRAYRPNRKNKLNVWFIMHENEDEIKLTKKINEIEIKDNNNYEFNFEINENEYKNLTQCTIIK